MSNHKSGERPDRRKPKVSLAMSISQGLGGPNPRSERIAGMDRRLIFRPFLYICDGVTEVSKRSMLLDSCFCLKEFLGEMPRRP